MYYLDIMLLASTIQAIDIEINGEVAFDVKISNLELGHGLTDFEYDKIERQLKYKNIERHLKNKKFEKDLLMRSNGTVAPVLECTYQYPERQQIDAMLSGMMNQLTKVFVRAREFIKGSNQRRMHATRFSVVAKEDTAFFENIYHNMTQEYMTFYNSTTSLVVRSGRDPCMHQEEIKNLWLDLLDAASLSIRQASRQCVKDYLKIHGIDEPEIKKKMEHFLLKELQMMRTNQLHLLCDSFQLCYHELL